MIDDLAAAGRTLECIPVDHTALDQIDLARDPGEVVALAGAEVVEDAYLLASVETGAHEVRANEAGAAGHQDAQT